jgi:hypothetical protein
LESAIRAPARPSAGQQRLKLKERREEQFAPTTRQREPFCQTDFVANSFQRFQQVMQESHVVALHVIHHAAHAIEAFAKAQIVSRIIFRRLAL